MCEISVVLPVYNGEEYIAESIESVLSQTFRDFELIIVNDCSTDGTAEIISRYAQQDKRIRTIHNAQNRKLPSSLNIGFRNACGKYLTWTSHDNRYKPEALACMHTELEKNPGYGLVYADYSVMDRDGNILRENPMGEPEAIYMANVVGACFLYRKSIACQTGEYDTNMFLAEDYDYWLRVCRYTKLRHLCRNLYLYRLHASSLSATRLESIRAQTARLWMKHLDFIIAGIPHRKKRWQFYDLIDSYMPAKDQKDTKKYLLQLEPLYGFHTAKKTMAKHIHALFDAKRQD